MGQHYHHFSALERNVLQQRLNLGSSQALIALTLGRSRSTVSREEFEACERIACLARICPKTQLAERVNAGVPLQ